MTTNRAEEALKVVIENIDPGISLAPMRLARCSRRLNETARRLALDTLGSVYTRLYKNCRIIEGGGVHMSGGEANDAVSVSVVPMLPENMGAHGLSCGLLQPFNYEVNDDDDIVMVPHRVTTFMRRRWYLGKLDGISIRLFTREHTKEPGELCVEEYEAGRRVGYMLRARKFDERMCLEIGKVMRNERIEVVASGEVPANYCTRAWRDICGDYTDKLWCMCQHYLTSDDAVARLFSNGAAAGQLMTT